MSDTRLVSTLSLGHIRDAYGQVPRVFRDSPQFISDGLSVQLGCRVLCKVECLNPIRSFKGRGASYFLRRQPPSGEPLVTASAGNFGQALAYAARQHGRQLCIFAATTANPVKVERMRALGAEVRLVGADFDAAKEEARAFADSCGLRLVEDGREPAIAEGAGTIALELSQWPEPLAAVLVPVGNGALINGVGRWLHAQMPGCRVIGVCPEQAPATWLSWRSGQLHTTATAETAADGIAIRLPIATALRQMQAAADDMVLVSEERLREAVCLLHQELGVVVEPSGAAGLAAAFELHPQFRGGLIAIVLTGGNIAPDIARAWL
jgi:threonine dehydratase